MSDRLGKIYFYIIKKEFFQAAETTVGGKKMFQKYEGRKAAALVGAIFSVCVLIFFVLVFWMNQRVKVIDVSDCVKEDAGSLVHRVEESGDFFNYLSMGGYAYKPGTDIESASINILAQDTDTGIYYVLPTEIEVREDITESVNDGHNYDYSGFKCVVYKSKLPKHFNLYILYQCNGEKILVDTSNES